MNQYKILAAVYLISVLSSSIANIAGIDVQLLYRVPFLNIRWIDIAILIIAITYCFSLTRYNILIKNNLPLVSLCLAYVIFEFFQLVRTWHATDTGWQISGFICTLNFFILIDFATYEKRQDEILRFLESFAFWGAIVITFTNLYLVYSFFKGNIIFTDLDTRVALELVGAKETVSTGVLTPLVYAFSLYFIRIEKLWWKKMLFAVTVLSIYVSLVIIFHRGNLFTIAALTLIYVFMFSSNASKAFRKLSVIGLLIIICFLLFGRMLQDKGYNPIDKLSELVSFTMDFDNPDWDKGRSIPKEYALAAWEQNFYIGVGYNDLQHYGLPEGIAEAHNFVVTSLFHRGIIGTGIYLLILLILFKNGFQLWKGIPKADGKDYDQLRLLIVVSFFWLIPFWTQSVIWEKYSLSVQFIYFGLITNLYRQGSLVNGREIVSEKFNKIILS